MKPIARATVTPVGPDHAQDARMGKHHIIVDEPERAGGQDAGAAPYQVLLASLGGCTNITLKMYAARKGWDIGDLKLTISMMRDDDGRDHVQRELSSDAPLSDEQWAKLIEIAGKTPVTKTLLAGMAITTQRAESAS